jgi:Lrp/AsnC family transcriptional regulator, leucine-responsive regulatory protein
MVHMGMDSHDGKSTRKFEEAIGLIPEVVWCHELSGAENSMLMVVVRDLDHFSTLPIDKPRKSLAAKSLQSGFSLKAAR